MKNAILCIVALAVTAIACADADAAIFGRRRGGGGGNMGANSGVCNMALSPVKPGQCAGGACNLQVEPAPAPALAPVSFRGDEEANRPERLAKSRKPAKRSRHAFEAFDPAPERIARR